MQLVDNELQSAEDLLTDIRSAALPIEELQERFRMRFSQQVLKEQERRLSNDRKLPYRTFISRTGTPIWVGRDARRNDQLTLKVAKPHHIWLHAKSITGAHVVLAIDKGAELASELLVDGAHLAAHFSEARGETIVEVSYVEKRYVRKPRKSPPGLVVIDREKVLTVRVDSDLLAKLLNSEKHEPLSRPIR